MIKNPFRKIKSSYKKRNDNLYNNNNLKITNNLITKDKKINTIEKINFKKINIIYKKLNSFNASLQNTTINSNNGDKFIISPKSSKVKSQIDFNSKNFENLKENFKTDKSDKSLKSKKKVNIINLSNLSLLYNSFDMSKSYKTFLIHKPLTYRTNSCNNENFSYNNIITNNNNETNCSDNNFKFLEKYFNSKRKISSKIREYKPNLNSFFINGTLKKLNKKSDEMMHIKDDLNEIYRNSGLLNNIMDYLGKKLYKIKGIKKLQIKNKLYKINDEGNYKKIIKLKLRRGEINKEKIYNKKDYEIDYLDINPKLKKKLIYKTGYFSNTIKSSVNKIKYRDQIECLNKHQE